MTYLAVVAVRPLEVGGEDALVVCGLAVRSVMDLLSLINVPSKEIILSLVNAMSNLSLCIRLKLCVHEAAQVCWVVGQGREEGGSKQCNKKEDR